MSGSRATEQHGDSHDRRRRRACSRKIARLAGANGKLVLAIDIPDRWPTSILRLTVPDLIADLVNPMSRPQGTPVAYSPRRRARAPQGTARPVHPGHHAHRAAQLQPRQLRRRRADQTTSTCREHGREYLYNTTTATTSRAPIRAPGKHADVPERGLPGTWDPRAGPPGEGQLQFINSPGLVQSVYDLVVGDGQDGCGFESQAEHRFLVGPRPESIALNGRTCRRPASTTRSCPATVGLPPVGLDTRDRRRLRRDEHLKETSYYRSCAGGEERDAVPAHGARRSAPPRARTTSAARPAAKAQPASCPAGQGAPRTRPTTARARNLALAFQALRRPDEHKARYGIRFFYPPSRYVNALTLPTVDDSTAAPLPNPIFSINPNDPGAVVRDLHRGRLRLHHRRPGSSSPGRTRTGPPA